MPGKMVPIPRLAKDASPEQTRLVVNEVVEAVKSILADNRARAPFLESGARVREGEIFADPTGDPLFHKRGKFFRMLLEDLDEPVTTNEVLVEMKNRIDALRALFRGGERWKEFWF